MARPPILHRQRPAQAVLSDLWAAERALAAVDGRPGPDADRDRAWLGRRLALLRAELRGSTGGRA